MGKFSVDNKMKNFVGNILQNTFYAYCYNLLSRRCTPICGRNLAAVNCILHWI